MTLSQKNLRILVVDDSIVFRMMISDVIGNIPGMEVVGTARDGHSALARVTSLKPDLMTLDIEMPGMDGMEVLTRLKSQSPQVGVIMLSSDAGRGSRHIITSLEAGAFDFVLKPSEKNITENKRKLEKDLAPLLRSFSRRMEIRSILNGHRTNVSPDRSALPPIIETKTPDPIVPAFTTDFPRNPSDVVAIGVSTGGPAALARLIPALPGDLAVPILIVQHMPPGFTRALAESLDRQSKVPVVEAQDGDILVPGKVFIAPGGSHMKIVSAENRTKRIIRITQDPPENGCRPSADYLFRSVAHHFKDRATGVIMTGMGQDGAKGLALMNEHRAVIIAQDEATSIVFGMAKQPVASGIVDIVAPLDNLAREIMKTVRPSFRM
ncbi:MAG: chemotaxis response regulator protein-glutamate methylesterase [Desulfotignum sp.]|nr:chemotaxis response regulator protein-glutamate methylesterase [Desulfotignum sp.]MCF8138231.1 chemotaxis response regulator protein-glutamate methylesterase [Desulfotignum sp.]